jgi:hypothetical protein
MTWVYLFACVSFSCGHGVVAVQGDGAYYATHELCMRAARRDPLWRYMRGREIVCVQRNQPQQGKHDESDE